MYYDEFKEKHKTKTNYLLYMGLTQAIPTKYKIQRYPCKNNSNMV